MTALGVVGVVLVAVVLVLGAVVLVFDRRRIHRVSARLTLTIDRDEPRSLPIRLQQTGHDMADNENSPLPSKAPEPRSPGSDPEPGTPEPTDPREGQEGPSTPEHEDADVSSRVVLIDGAVTVEPVPDEPDPEPAEEPER